MKVIYLGAGGFWTTEAVYKQVKGVQEVIPGYMGGSVANPSHETVATGMTGHAEVVKILFDEQTISINELLGIFYALHDPATPAHAGQGIGSQYRPVIFYTEEGDGEATDSDNGGSIGVIQKNIEQLQATLPEGIPVSTHVMNAVEFYAADESHYDYYQQHRDDSYSTTIIEPVIKKIKNQFPHLFIL